MQEEPTKALEALRKQVEDYRLLCDILVGLGASLQVEETLQRILDGALSLTGAHQGSVLLFNPAGQDEARTLLRQKETAGAGLDHYLNTLLAGWVSRHKRALLTHDLGATFGADLVPAKYRSVSSVLAVPLRLGDDVLGTLILVKLAGERFHERQLEPLTVLANLCAQYTANARLHETLFAETTRLRRQVLQKYAVHGILGRSAKMQEVFALLDQVIPTEGRVLLQGESGTGKELVARVLHYNGPRKRGPFVAVDCGAVPPTLLESELFGHLKGAFTGAHRDKKGLFEEAHGGTLFLDEIVNLPLEVQAKLLRAIEHGEIRPVGSTAVRKVDVRIIAAASDDLQKRVEQGRFREDLFYRLNVVTIDLPPLRERKEDIPLLATTFVERLAPKYNKAVQGFKPETMAALEAYNWPGNVRELENTIERMVILAAPDALHLGPELLPPHVRQQEMQHVLARLSEDAASDIRSMKAAFEKFLVEQALRRHNGNRSAAARELGVSERAIRYKLRKYGLTEPDPS